MSSLDNLRKAAKRWLKQLRESDPAARSRLLRAHPHAPERVGLRDVQHALALERGAANWKALRAIIEAEDAARAAASPEATLTAFLRAAEQGDAARVAMLAEAHPEIVNRRGMLAGHSGLRTALHFGVGHEAVVRTLLERGADPNIRDEGDNAMPLHFAAENQDFPIIRLLVEHGADPIGEGDGHALEIIGWACCWDYREANREIVDYLVAHGARHHIFSAVTMGDVEIIKRLVAQSPDALTRRMDRTNKRRTPLHQAVVKKQPLSMATLIALGADLEALDEAGLTPLDQAAVAGAAESAQLLIDHGAAIRLPAAVALQRTDDIARLMDGAPDQLAPGQPFGTLIVRAAGHSPGVVVEQLIALGASVNVRDDEATSVDQTRGYTPLHAAAFHGNEEAVRVLLRHGADINAREEKYGGTPAGWADYAGHRHIRDLILRGPIDMIQAIDFDVTERIPQLLKTDPEALNRPFRGCSPLAWAAGKNNLEAAKFLIGEGAELIVPDDKREELARAPGYEAVMKLLAARSAAPAPPAAGTHAERVATFLEFACWDHRVHGKGDHRMYDRAAQRQLAQHPEMARDSLYTAVVCGDIDEVRRILAERPEAAVERGGAREWSPLLYLCFTRFSHPPAIENAVAIATELLDLGANPNDYYMAGHSRYSALVGIAREGEQDAPPHPRREELFQLLLEHGASMYDAQVLYNTHFHGDVLWWLKLVYAHAIKLGRQVDWADPNWSMLDMGGYGPGATYLLVIAVENDDLELAKWLLAHGASPNAVNAKHPRVKPPHTVYELAVRSGRTAIADLLLQHGARRTLAPLEGEDAFVDACLRVDRDAVSAHLADYPEYLRSTRALFEAAERNRPEAVQLLLEAGVPVDLRNEHNAGALHHAAASNAVAVAQLLIARGAEIDPRDSQWHSTPIGWAAHGDKREMVDLLSRHSRDVWTLAFGGYVDRLGEVLREDPSRASVTANDGTTPLWWLPDDEDKAVAIVDLLLAGGADPNAHNKDGQIAADWAQRRGMSVVARKLRGL